jgi:hypothetical protein
VQLGPAHGERGGQADGERRANRQRPRSHSGHDNKSGSSERNGVQAQRPVRVNHGDDRRVRHEPENLARLEADVADRGARYTRMAIATCANWSPANESTCAVHSARTPRRRRPRGRTSAAPGLAVTAGRGGLQRLACRVYRSPAGPAPGLPALSPKLDPRLGRHWRRSPSGIGQGPAWDVTHLVVTHSRNPDHTVTSPGSPRR